MKKLKLFVVSLIAILCFSVINIDASNSYSRISFYDRVAQIQGDCSCIDMENSNDTHAIIVRNDYSFNDNYYYFLSDYFVLDLRGKTLTNKNTTDGKYKTLFEVGTNAKLTIIDSVGGGKIEGGILVSNGGTLIINSGIIGHSNLSGAGITVNGGTVIINGGTFFGTDGGLQVTNSSASIKIKSGRFEAKGPNHYGAISMIKEGNTSFNLNGLLTEGSKFSNSSFEENSIGDNNYYVLRESINVYKKNNINISEEIANGSVSADKSLEYCNETITLTTTPNTGYQLKSIKIYNNNTDVTNLVKYNIINKTFIMPDYDVTIMAEFELIPVTTYTITFNRLVGVTYDKTSPIIVESGDDKDIIITADTGYKLKSVKVNGVEKLSALKSDKLSLTNITANQTIVVEAIKIYDVTNGAGQKHTIGTNEDAVFRINADKSLFNKVYLNDDELNSVFYTITEGSTIITLKQDFINNLLPGTYNLKATFSDGGEANTTFVVAHSTVNNPKTGDSIMLSIIFGSISLIGLLGVGLYLKKKNV